MEHPLYITNSLSRQKEQFTPENPPLVGLYVCGPTVYGDAHLGHARPAITFDLLYRYLQHLGYKVRYVRNITDVGHLEGDADEGEDKIAKKARLEQLEPMEIAHHYTTRYHGDMERLNTLPPSIEPQATGHIIEQIQMIEKIIENGYGYVSDGSVYFDIEKYDRDYKYGELSGRKTEDMLTNTRELAGQQEKRNPLDFALWKKAEPQHIMKWPSPWSLGFPGWHIECSAMSTRYLGETFDIHGGGMDLLFPHHEAEIAQSTGACGHSSARYWMHNNLITINGQKMGKSLGNFITLEELFGGTHKLLEQPYSPMTVRFFILQAHYRSTLDFSNEALLAASKGLTRLMQSYTLMQELEPAKESTWSVQDWTKQTYAVMNDDLNAPKLIALLFEGASVINKIKSGSLTLTQEDLEQFRQQMKVWVEDVLGLEPEATEGGHDDDKLDEVMELLLKLRQEAKGKKDFATADAIRDRLKDIGFRIMDTKEGATWSEEK